MLRAGHKVSTYVSKTDKKWEISGRCGAHVSINKQKLRFLIQIANNRLLIDKGLFMDRVAVPHTKVSDIPLNYGRVYRATMPLFPPETPPVWLIAQRRAPNDRHLHLITSCHATYANSVAMIPTQKQRKVNGRRLLAY